ncbi:MAG TPA: hypothetical protein DCM86_14260 [Verrucomicrobiales bacterium]|nr:hypothetical protein [Verrucomicrobiales bacterium]
MILRLTAPICLLTLIAALLPAPRAGASSSSREPGGALLQDSLVELEVNRKQYDYQTPWNRGSGSVHKSGIIVSTSEILTTADGLSERTLIRVQRGGRGKWWEATVTWIDYHANLALVGTGEAEFWKGVRPVDFAPKLTSKDDFQIHRWRSGNMEVRKAEFNQFMSTDAKLSFVQHAQVELSSEINGVGWGEPVMVGNRFAGLVTSQTRNLCVATPAPFIRFALDSRKKGTYRGLGYFDFVWQPSENPAVHQYLGFTGEPRGVVVIEGAHELGQTNLIRPHDLILEVDGFEIDSQGNYHDPMYGHLLLENLATRNHWAGEEVRIKVWREGKSVDVAYRLPKADFETRLMPDYLFDQEPEYLIVGGLVFQPLSNQYLRAWGDDWKRRAPFRLNYYNNEAPSKDRPALVILSSILPDPYTLGYQDLRLLVVDKLNGKTISRLTDLEEALKSPVEGFHVIEYMRGDSVRKMVLSANGTAEATQRVLDRYGISQDRLVRKH